MKKILLLAALLTIAVGLHAQQVTLTGGNGAATNCATQAPPSTSTNTLCFATDGIYVSIAGAAYVKIQTVVGSSTIVGGSCSGTTPMMTGISQTGVPTCGALPTQVLQTTISCSGVTGTLTATGNALKLSGCQ